MTHAGWTAVLTHGRTGEHQPQGFRNGLPLCGVPPPPVAEDSGSEGTWGTRGAEESALPTGHARGLALVTSAPIPLLKTGRMDRPDSGHAGTCSPGSAATLELQPTPRMGWQTLMVARVSTQHSWDSGRHIRPQTKKWAAVTSSTWQVAPAHLGSRVSAPPRIPGSPHQGPLWVPLSVRHPQSSVSSHRRLKGSQGNRFTAVGCRSPRDFCRKLNYNVCS